MNIIFKKSNIDMFLEEHKDLRDVRIVRALYMRGCTTEYFVFESEHETTYVFKYSCGCFYECQTEKNTFDNYFLLVPKSDYVEYINKTSDR